MEFVLLMETLKAANSAERKRGEGEAHVPLKKFSWKKEGRRLTCPVTDWVI